MMKRSRKDRLAEHARVAAFRKADKKRNRQHRLAQAKATKRDESRERQHRIRADKRATAEKPLKDQILRILENPTVSGVKRLVRIIENPALPDGARVVAAKGILRIGYGNAKIGEIENGPL